MSSVPERSEIPMEYRWDLSDLFESDDDWERAFAAVEESVEELSELGVEDVADGGSLLDVLERRDEVDIEAEKVIKYAALRRDEDTRDSDTQAMYNRALALDARFDAAISFLEPAIQSFSEAELEAMVAETPGLAVYEHHLRDVHRVRPHTRSAEVENLLAELSDVTDAPGDVYRMLLNADLSFPPVERPDGETVEITQSNFTTLQKHENREFRRRVHEAFFGGFDGMRNTIATAYERSIAANVKVARARNYETAREESLDGPNVPVSVYDTLLETVEENLDTLHRHAELKRRFLDVDDLQMWDLYTPLVAGEDPEVPYETAREYVVAAVEPLGAEYQRRVERGLESRWVDVYENQGKRSGAYSAGIYASRPYVLMNFQEDVDSTFTLAHELGHSLHSQLSSETQPVVYSDYSIFTAEVASTVNETLLTHYLLENAGDETLRKYALNQYLERFRSTLFRQTMFADFEHRAHRRYEQGEAVTADELDGIYRDLKSRFYEPAVVDEHIAHEWMRIPHFYNEFYVYQYSTGIAAAATLASKILSEGEPAAERYREFLRRGSRGYPIDLLADAGVDMTTAEPVQRAIDVYDEHLDEMEALL